MSLRCIRCGLEFKPLHVHNYPAPRAHETVDHTPTRLSKVNRRRVPGLFKAGYGIDQLTAAFCTYREEIDNAIREAIV